ncbi:hypothetical protein ACFUEN_35865 [Streptomyces griseorubiginosus]|uniref:hypothetical protein n=1 Tax=Streptomyces griseorubiginosus TaxID=67304 RepID=UPI003635A4B9
MTAHHAIEIHLTRPITPGELGHLRRGVSVAANADRTRLMTVHAGRSPRRALHTLRRRLGAQLPIDVLTTHYPDKHGQVLLNVALGHRTNQLLCQAAAATGQRPRDVLRERMTEAIARDEQRRAQLLTARLEDLLAQHTPEEVLACAAGLLHSRQRCRTPPEP